MATKLKNLKIKKVDFVDNGANPGASIALYKSKPAEGEVPAVKPEEDTPPEESFLKRIVHAIAKSIGATDAQADAAVEVEFVVRIVPPSHVKDFFQQQRREVFQHARQDEAAQENQHDMAAQPPQHCKHQQRAEAVYRAERAAEEAAVGEFVVKRPAVDAFAHPAETAVH